MLRELCFNLVYLATCVVCEQALGKHDKNILKTFGGAILIIIIAFCALVSFEHLCISTFVFMLLKEILVSYYNFLTLGRGRVKAKGHITPANFIFTACFHFDYSGQTAIVENIIVVQKRCTHSRGFWCSKGEFNVAYNEYLIVCLLASYYVCCSSETCSRN